MCLLGPDGSGKTVLALHLAARYLHDAARQDPAADIGPASTPSPAGTASADRSAPETGDTTVPESGAGAGGAADANDESQTEPGDPARAESVIGKVPARSQLPRVIYASVDLSLEKAVETAKHFLLDHLAKRDDTLYPVGDGKRDDPKLRLQHPALDRTPLEFIALPDEGELVNFVEEGPASGGVLQIGFLDLLPKTDGDPWNYLRRVVALLAQGSSQQAEKPDPPPLLIVDSTDGLYTLSGGIDAYGEERSRDARVSQLLGTARNAAHLVLLVGAATPDERPAEAFLTDCVLRLRVLEEAGYQSRSVEVEKVRAQGSVSGKHRFTIRTGMGASTGKQQNPDDPRFELSLPGAGEKTVKRNVAYVRVFHSIDFLDSYERAVRDDERGDPKQPSIPSEFTGVEFLDSMLPVRGKEAAPSRFQLGTVTAVIGSPKTFKSNIGRAFLARGIFTREMLEAAHPPPDHEKDGIGILLTTDDLRPERLAEHLAEWVKPSPDDDEAEDWAKSMEEWTKSIEDWAKSIQERVICRRLEVNTIYPETLAHILLRSIYEARQRLGITGDDTRDSQRMSGKIRLVIDDWNTICQIYPAIARDSKCLQFLLREIRRLGVTALIVHSQAMSPGQLFSAGSGNNLAGEANTVFTTWPVAFRGARLAAVCVGETARFSEPTIVREIRNRKHSDERIIVDPHLELYRGLLAEESEPEPVPLRVCLLDEEHAGKEYLERTNALFRELFAPIHGQGRSVVETVGCGIEAHTAYEQMRAVSYFQTGSLDHTLIMLIDEFWGVRKHHSFLRLKDYFHAETECEDREVRLLRDPHELFQRRLDHEPSPSHNASTPDEERITRGSFFAEELFHAPRLPQGWAEPIDKKAETQNRAATHSAETAADHASRDSAAVVGPPASASNVHAAPGGAAPALSPEEQREPNEGETTSTAADESASPSGTATDAPSVAPSATAESTARSNRESLGMLNDRVPYSWDYAFLCCRLRAWENAQLRRVEVWDVSRSTGTRPTGKLAQATVREIWERLDRGANPLLPLLSRDEPDRKVHPVDAGTAVPLDPSVDLGSWRWFLGAAAMVARSDNLFASKKIIAFDFHSAGPESLGSWILEVWASEIMRTIKRNEWLKKQGFDLELTDGYTKQCADFERWAECENSSQGLLAWLGVSGDARDLPQWDTKLQKTGKYSDLLKEHRGWVIELYKTLRMLWGFVDNMGWMEEQQARRFAPHSPAPGAVAVRHYYKTAAAAREAFKHDDPTVALPMPGKFSTRGDLALGIARGSRSVRLGERSIDKLCSRAANEIRLETGIGFPVRTMTQGERGALFTRMVTVDRFAQKALSDGEYYPPFYVRPLRYAELLRTAPCEERGSFWLWRSRLENYDCQSAVWHKWLYAVFEEFQRISRGRGAVWVESLQAYDQVERWQCGRGRKGVAPELTTYQHFGAWCDRLIARLLAATQG